MKRSKLAVCGFEVIYYPEHLFKTYVFEKCPDYQCSNINYKYTYVDDSYKYVDEFGNLINDSYDLIVDKLEEHLMKLRDSWALHYFGSILDYAFCLHDRDMTVDKDGVLRLVKPHFHIYIWTDDKNDYPLNSYWADVIACELNLVNLKSDTVIKRKRTYDHYFIEPSLTLINPIKKLHSALRYMIHIDNNSKERYDLSSCISSINLFLHPAFREATVLNEVTFLLDACKSRRVISYDGLVDYAAQMGMLDIALKYQYLFLNYCRSLSGAARDLTFGKPQLEPISVDSIKQLNTNQELVNNG